MRRILLVLLTTIGHANIAAAVPPNDECDGAIPITGFGLFPFDSTDASRTEIGWLWSDEFADFISMDADVWFLWTPPTDSWVTVDTCGLTTVDTVLAEIPHSCGPDAGGGCSDDQCRFQSRLTFYAHSQSPHYIGVGAHAGLGGGMGFFRISPEEPTDPPNPFDLGCPSPTQPLPAAALETCNARDRFDAINSTRLQFLVADDFVPAENGTLHGVCWWGTYSRDGVVCQRDLVDFFEITYFADDCGVPGEIIAGPFSQEDVTMDVIGPIDTFTAYPNHALEYQYSAAHDPVAVEGGRTYWISVTNSRYNNCSWFWGTASGHAGYAIQTDDRDDTMTSIPTDLAFCFRIVETDGQVCEEDPPANDDCDDAVPFAVGVTFDTYGATTDGPINVPTYPPEPSACDFPLGDEQVHRDIWYTFDAQCASTVHLTTCESNFDTKLAVYQGLTCPSAPAIACDDDACGDDLARQSRLGFQARPDQSYLIRVGGYSGAWGQGSLTAELQPPTRTSLREFAVFALCASGGDGVCCEFQDFNQDGEVNLDDYPAFQQTLVGP